MKVNKVSRGRRRQRLQRKEYGGVRRDPELAELIGLAREHDLYALAEGAMWSLLCTISGKTLCVWWRDSNRVVAPGGLVLGFAETADQVIALAVAARDQKSV